MKRIVFGFLALATTALAQPGEKLTDFELSDQHQAPRRYHFPKEKVSVVTVADHKGSEQLAPWIQRLHARYQKRVDIDGVADVSVIPAAFHGMFRNAFKKQLSYSVMLDWSGDVVKQFAPQKGVANIYVIDRRGRILKHVTGPVNEAGLSELAREIDRALKQTSQ